MVRGETTALAGKANSEEMVRRLGIKSNYVLAATVSVSGDGEAAVGQHKGFWFVSRTLWIHNQIHEEGPRATE